MSKSYFVYFEANEEQYQCLICGRCFLLACDEQVLSEHLHQSHRKKTKEVPLNTDKTLLNHFSKQGRIKYTCNYCGELFNSAGFHKNNRLVFARHIHKMHKDKVSSDILKIVFLKSRKGNLNFAADHVTFKALKIKQCKYCSFVYPKGNNCFVQDLVRHLIDFHKEIIIPESIQKRYSRKKYECQFCGKITGSPSLLESHEARHLDEKRFFCEFCHKGFVERFEIKRHVLHVHSDEKPIICSVCGKRFKTKTILKTHTRVHTGETPFQCNKCEKKFKFQATRDNHKCLIYS